MAAALDAIKDLPKDATTAAKQDAISDLDAAIATANTARGNALDAAKLAEDKVTKTLDQNPTVAAAKDALETAKTDAGNDEGTTQDILDATTALNNAIAAANAADQAIADAATTANPYSQEPAVKAALTAIKALPATADTAAKQDAINDLVTAVAAAKQPRQDAKDAATAAEGTVTSTLALNPTVAAAKQAVADAVTAADGNTGTTQQIKDAIADLNTAVADAEDADAAIAAAATTSSPYGLEPDVAKALAAIKALPATATTAAKNDALDALTAAVEAAKQPRLDANDAANAAEATVTSDLAQNPTVAAAKQKLVDAVANAKANAGTTQQIQAAIDALNTAVADANDVDGEIAAATKAASPYSLEPDVAKALAAIKALPATATTAAKQDAVKTLNAAVATATQPRGDANDGATAAEKTVTAALEQNPTVAKAKKTLVDAVYRAAADQGTTQEILDATDALNQAVKAANAADTAIANAADSAKPYGKEPDVAKALDAIANLAPDATTAAKEAAIATLNDAVAAAKPGRETATKAAESATGKVTTALAQNPAVAKAQAALAQAQANATGDAGTSAEVEAAAAALNKAVADAEAAIANATDALNQNARPVNNEQPVQQAKAALAAALADPTTPDAELTKLADAYTAAIAAAKQARTTAVTNGDALKHRLNEAGLTANRGVAAALARYEQVKRDAANGKATTAEVEAAAAALKAAIAKALVPRAAKQETAQAALPAAGDATNGLAVAGMAIVGMMGLLGLAKKRRDEEA